MRQDAIYYKLFQWAPTLLFALLDHFPEGAERYRFASVEVKEPDFRIDGVFLPPDDAPHKVIYFAEVQFQQDQMLYHRFFCESLLYLYRNPTLYDDWHGVLIFPSRRVAPTNATIHRALLDSEQVSCIYLDELGDIEAQPTGIQLMLLTVIPEAEAIIQARRLLNTVRSRSHPYLGSNRDTIIDIITTIIVYKFTSFSREEIITMLGLNLEESRLYQEIKAEGVVEGEQRGEQRGRQQEAIALVLRQLARRLQQELPQTMISRIQALSLPQVEALAEALLDFTCIDDLEQWFTQHEVQEVTD